MNVGFLYCVGCILLKQVVLARCWTKCPRQISTTSCLKVLYLSRILGRFGFYVRSLKT